MTRSAWYYQPRPLDPQDLERMRLIGKQYLKTPFYGSRKMHEHLRRQGYPVNRKRMQRLMRVMRLEAIYPKARTVSGREEVAREATASNERRDARQVSIEWYSTPEDARIKLVLYDGKTGGGAGCTD